MKPLDKCLANRLLILLRKYERKNSFEQFGNSKQNTKVLPTYFR